MMNEGRQLKNTVDVKRKVEEEERNTKSGSAKTERYVKHPVD